MRFTHEHQAPSHDRASLSELRTAALCMVAASEYFKAAGQLPAWARAELDEGRLCDAIDRERHARVLAAAV